MEGSQFDHLVKRLGTTRLTRLAALRGLVAGALAGATGVGLTRETGAKKNNKDEKEIRICNCASSNPSTCKTQKKEKKKAKKTLRRNPCAYKGRCQSGVSGCAATAPVVPPAGVTPLPPAQCQAGQTACGAGCCPNSAPVCCGGFGGEALSCWAAGTTCCSAVGGTGACAGGSQCCAGAADTDEQAFEQTYCIGDDPDFTCCPWDSNGLCDRDLCTNCGCCTIITSMSSSGTSAARKPRRTITVAAAHRASSRTTRATLPEAAARATRIVTVCPRATGPAGGGSAPVGVAFLRALAAARSTGEPPTWVTAHGVWPHGQTPCRWCGLRERPDGGGSDRTESRPPGLCPHPGSPIRAPAAPDSPAHDNSHRPLVARTPSAPDTAEKLLSTETTRMTAPPHRASTASSSARHPGAGAGQHRWGSPADPCSGRYRGAPVVRDMAFWGLLVSARREGRQELRPIPTTSPGAAVRWLIPLGTVAATGCASAPGSPSGDDQTVASWCRWVRCFAIPAGSSPPSSATELPLRLLAIAMSAASSLPRARPILSGASPAAMAAA